MMTKKDLQQLVASSVVGLTDEDLKQTIQWLAEADDDDIAELKGNALLMSEYATPEILDEYFKMFSEFVVWEHKRRFGDE